MKMKEPYLSQTGFSLVELLVAIGIMGIMMAGFAAMQSNQYKDIRGLSEQLAALTLQTSILSVLADGKVCTIALTAPTPKTFDSTSPTSTIILDSIPASAGSTTSIAQVGTVASPMSQTLIVQKIQITDFQQDSSDPNQYLARIHVGFNSPPATIRSLKDIQIPIVLTVTGGGTTSAKVVTCKASGGNGTPNYLAAWASTATLGSSSVYQDPGGNVGIGTSSPKLSLDVNGGIKMGFSTVCVPGALRYNPATTGTMEFCDNTSTWKPTGGSLKCNIVSSGAGTGTRTATCPADKTLTGGSCEMHRAGDGRVMGNRACVPSGNSMTCAEGNGGLCQAHAICCD